MRATVILGAALVAGAAALLVHGHARGPAAPAERLVPSARAGTAPASDRARVARIMAKPRTASVPLAPGRRLRGLAHLVGDALARTEDLEHAPPRLETTPAVEAEVNQRLDRYLDGELGPRAKPCFDALGLHGELTVVGNYVRDPADDANPWTVDGFELVDSQLPEEQDAAVLACVERAARGTSFPSAAWDRSRGTEFSVYLTLDFPFHLRPVTTAGG